MSAEVELAMSDLEFFGMMVGTVGLPEGKRKSLAIP